MKIRFTKLVKQAMAGKITRKKFHYPGFGGGEVRLSSPLFVLFTSVVVC